MPSLWFCMPVHGRQRLATICLEQLRRTCDTLTGRGVDATAVVVGDDANLETATELGFATVRRDNAFVSRKFNDGIQAACDTRLPERGGTGVNAAPTLGKYLVTGRREYRGHARGSLFEAYIEPGPEYRAVKRGDIELLERVVPTLAAGSYDLTDHPIADYVVPIGSDDFVHPNLFNPLPPADTMFGFQRMSFVREDGRELTVRHLQVRGGCGIRIYPRQIMEKVGYRPADEDRTRACDTTILTNLTAANAIGTIEHRVCDPLWIVDWKTDGRQLNPYGTVDARHPSELRTDPFEALDGMYPAQALADMRAHYGPPTQADKQPQPEEPKGSSLVREAA